MNQDHSTNTAKAAFIELREDLARVLGLQTVDLLIDRGVTEIREAYPLVGSIVVRGGELDLGSLDDAFVNSQEDEAVAALNALTAVMLLIMARLLGKQVAESIAQSVDKSSLLRTIRL